MQPSERSASKCRRKTKAFSAVCLTSTATETDPGEEWIAFNIFNEVTKEDEDDIFYDADEEDDDDLDIDPEAFDDEYDYSEALEDL